MGIGKVMIVDDDREVLTAMSKFLSRRGYDIVAIEDGQEAIDRLNNGHHDSDVLITDLAMPRTGGLDILRSVHVTSPDLPVILTTGHGDASDRQSAHELGAFEVLEKPIGGDELVAAVERALDLVSDRHRRC